MYAKNGDRRIPPGILIPENYGGNTFSPQPPSPPPRPPEPPPPAAECHTCGDATKQPEGVKPQHCGKCDLPPPPAPPLPRPHHGGLMDISIGTEELLLIGVMALVFFGGEERDNELLICLLLVLLL